MAGNSNQKRRSNSVKTDDERALHQLLIHASQKVKNRFNLRNSVVKDAMLDIRHQLHNREWTQPDFSGIDFDDIVMCCAYLERYAVCHAALVRQCTQWFLRKISGSNIERFLFQGESLKVVCVGGGPGNDLLGFCSVVEGVTRTFKDLQLTVVDLKRGWETVFNEVMSTARSLDFGQAGTLLEDENVQVTLKFRQADLICEMVDEVKQADLILMVKVLSNVRGSKRSKMLKNIFSAMKDEAVFFYIDVLASKVKEQANKPSSNMNVRFLKKRQTFGLSISKKESKDLNLKSTYEMCVLQKALKPTSIIATNEEKKQIDRSDEENCQDNKESNEGNRESDGESNEESSESDSESNEENRESDGESNEENRESDGESNEESDED